MNKTNLPVGFERTAKKIAAVFITAVLAASQLCAKNYYGQANDYLQYGVGARSLAMGSAFSALVNDASAPYYNPAGLALLDDYQIMTMHAPFFMDTSLNYVAAVYPMGPLGAIAFSDVMMLSDKFEERNLNNAVVSSNQKVMNNTAMLSYGVTPYKGISAGINIKLLQEKVFGVSGTAMGADLGFIYQPISMLSLGLLAANLNEPSITLDETANYYRRNLKFGVALKAMDDRVLFTSDINKLKNEKAYFTFGFEASPIEYLAIRAGLNQYSEITYGIGFKMNPISIDYAYSPHDLGNLSRVSMNFYWGNIYRARLHPERTYTLSGLHNEIKFPVTVPEFVVKYWELKIMDSKKEVVKSLSSDTRPPEKILWDGKDKADRPVPKGRYYYQFDIVYKNDKHWKEKGNFELDLSAANERGGAEIKINNQEYPQFNEPPQHKQLEEVPVKEAPAAEQGQ